MFQNDKLVRATRALGIVKKRDDYLKVNPTAVGAQILRFMNFDNPVVSFSHTDKKEKEALGFAPFQGF